MELVFIFCNPLLHNIIQVNCLTLYVYASVKVISLKKNLKNDPSLDTLCRVGGVTLSIQLPGHRQAISFIMFS